MSGNNNFRSFSKLRGRSDHYGCHSHFSTPSSNHGSIFQIIGRGCEKKIFVPFQIVLLPQFYFFYISVPPKIHHVTSGGHLQVRKGSPVRLECSASGNPAPNITWTRKNNLLPNGKCPQPIYHGRNTPSCFSGHPSLPILWLNFSMEPSKLEAMSNF